MANNRNIAVENAKIMFRNFRGEARQYNSEGDRNFNLVLTEEQKEFFDMEGFKVRTRPPRDEYSDPQYLLPVTVSYKGRPPKVFLIAGNNKTPLDEESIGMLDFAEIDNIDLTINPYHWSLKSGASGVKAYLNSMYVTLVEDDFDGKYSHIPTKDDE
jgi:hypothetical protein